MTTTELFKTADLALAAVLMLLLPDWLLSVDKSNPKRVIFAFRKGPEIESLTRKYWSRELLVEPQAFANEIKQAKVRIYNQDPI